jgi:hypothetical protein
MTSLVFLFAAFFADPNMPDPNRAEIDAASKAIAHCYQQEAAKLDDGTSSTDAIASAVIRACSSHLEAMDAALRRKIIALVNSIPDLSQPEKDKIIEIQLAEKPQEMRSMLEQKALLAVRVERSRKKFPNATN